MGGRQSRVAHAEDGPTRPLLARPAPAVQEPKKKEAPAEAVKKKDASEQEPAKKKDAEPAEQTKKNASFSGEYCTPYDAEEWRGGVPHVWLGSGDGEPMLDAVPRVSSDPKKPLRVCLEDRRAVHVLCREDFDGMRQTQTDVFYIVSPGRPVEFQTNRRNANARVGYFNSQCGLSAGMEVHLDGNGTRVLRDGVPVDAYTQ